MKHHNKRPRRKTKERNWTRRDVLPSMEDIGLEDEPFARWTARAGLDDFEDDEPRPRQRDFDVRRWREDLTERSTHRERMRARDLRKGVYRTDD